MKLNPELIHRNLMGEDLFIPIGQTALNKSGVYVMNPVGARIWELLRERKQTRELLPILLEEYEVEEATLRSDVDEFISSLQKLGMLIEE